MLIATKQAAGGSATARIAPEESSRGSVVDRPFMLRGGWVAGESDLLRSVQAGDEEAFAELFRRYGPVAYNLAFRLLREQFMAEEVVQEVFLALWRKSDGFSEARGSVRSWLLSAVHHKAVDTIR